MYYKIKTFFGICISCVLLTVIIVCLIVTFQWTHLLYFLVFHQHIRHLSAHIRVILTSWRIFHICGVVLLSPRETIRAPPVSLRLRNNVGFSVDCADCAFVCPGWRGEVAPSAEALQPQLQQLPGGLRTLHPVPFPPELQPARYPTHTTQTYCCHDNLLISVSDFYMHTIYSIVNNRNVTGREDSCLPHLGKKTSATNVTSD